MHPVKPLTALVAPRLAESAPPCAAALPEHERSIATTPRRAIGDSNLARTQATRDWLVMELDDIRLDDHVFNEMMRTCDLEPHWRPQACLRL